MKFLMTVVALSIATAIAAPALAQTEKKNPPTQAECEKMQDMRWDSNSQTCLPK